MSDLVRDYDRPLFDPGAGFHGSARHDDRPAAVMAASEMDHATLSREQQRVLDTLRLLDAAGMPLTAGRVTRLLGDRQRSCVARRITDLRERGLVVDTGEVFREDRKGARPETLWAIA